MPDPIKPADKAAPASDRVALWHKVHKAASVQTPDGVDNPQGSVIDASVFPADLLNHYIEEGYLRPVASPEG